MSPSLPEAALVSADRSLLLFLNGLHCDFLDPVMYYGTRTSLWLPLYLLVLYAVIRQYGWRSVYVLLCAALLVTFSDQLANLFKEWTARPRPCNNLDIGPSIHIVNGYKSGGYSFYSAHASTNLALAVFCILTLGKNRFIAPVMLSYALFMSYTRIYLGVHYPSDILAGWIAGALIGYGCAKISLLLTRQKS